MAAKDAGPGAEPPGYRGPMALPPRVLDELRAALVERRSEAEARLSSLGRHFRDIVEAADGSNVDDEHDPEGATIAFERSQVDAFVRQGRAHLEEIDAALERLDRGTHGTCEQCGRPIPAGRLEVRPTARRCVDCA